MATARRVHHSMQHSHTAAESFGARVDVLGR